MTSHSERERLVRWSDPGITARAARTMPGLDLLNAILSGTLPPPPAVAILGVSMDAVARGRVTMSLMPDEAQYNPLGTVHGGVLTTLLDSVMGCAVHSTLPAGRAYTTLSVSVNFVKGVTLATGRITAEGTVIHSGRSTSLASATLRDQAGTLHATAESTCMLLGPA